MNFAVRILQEPLLHFLILGAGLFGLSYAFSASTPPVEPETILVSKQRLMNLALIFQRTWQRPPTQQELDAIVEEFVKEEILYREAMARELDRDDTKIRRLLRQKLEFVVEAMADVREPTDQELQEFLDENPESFRLESRLSFQQVYLSQAARGDNLQSDAASLLVQLRENAVDASKVGDPSLLSPIHNDLRKDEIAAIFGPRFAEELQQLEAGKWNGPVISAYGAHLVLIKKKTAGSIPELDQIRPSVHREWIATRRANSKEEFYQSLRKKYDVVIDELDVKNEKPPAESAE